jgi:Flp pilus assembly protein TadG
MKHLLARRRRRGQSLVEFALVAPLFFLVLFGIIDIGRYVYVTTAFNQAAREGARFGSVEQWFYTCPASASPKTRQVCSQEVAKANVIAGPPVFTVTATCASSCRAGDLLTVEVKSPPTNSPDRFRFFTPVISSLITPPVITGEASVVIQ